MKTITKFLLLPSMVLALLKCADTYKWLDRIDPLLYINSTPKKFTLEDSIKTSFKTGETAEAYSFTLTAESPIPESLLVDQAPLGFLTIEGTPAQTGDIIPMSPDKLVLNCTFQPKVDTDSTYEFLFRLRDLGDWHSHPVSVKIKLYKNIAPVARFTVSKVKEGTYDFDATNSYDKDAAQAKSGKGGIKTYSYTITDPDNNKKVIENLKEKIFQYGFNVRGKHTVTLVVVDSDALKSEPFSQEVDVD